ncbi:MAG: NAD+ synthase, partial [Microthrixaceae bacterium]|nr:NAD+ synthase [Microthrixaceae bacterium]
MPARLPVIAIAQINVTVGDIHGNAKKILAYHKKAAAQGAQLVVFPELCLIGYPPEDLVLMPDFCKEAMRAARQLAKAAAKGPAMIVGAPWQEGGKTYNAALLLDKGKVAQVQYKTRLPNYGVFDEKRVFSAGAGPRIWNWRGRKLGVLICEDMWTPALAAKLKRQGARQLIVVNASPFEAGKTARRKKAAAAAVKASRLPLLYVNLVGGQDDLVFDGGSFVMDAKGKVTAQLPGFEETIVILSAAKDLGKDPSASPQDDNEKLWQAMKLGLADYVGKNGFKAVVLGLSGGVDSALTAACAVDALGPANVKGVLLPSPVTSRESVEDALQLARNLGIETLTIPITEAMQTFEERLDPIFKDIEWMKDVAIGGNLQARTRGVMLMALTNRFGWMLLSTANKSEIAVGYSTLYGDSCGAYNVLKDIYKTQVYALAKWRNADGAIPARILTKAPTAELAPGQKDEDQLPPYPLLDKILALHIENRKSAAEIIAK